MYIGCINTTVAVVKTLWQLHTLIVINSCTYVLSWYLEEGAVKQLGTSCDVGNLIVVLFEQGFRKASHK